MKKQSSIEKLHAEGSELISKHLNGKISSSDLIIMYHNLYYDAQKMHKQEIIEAWDSGEANCIHRVIQEREDCLQYGDEYYKNTYEKE